MPAGLLDVAMIRLRGWWVERSGFGSLVGCCGVVLGVGGGAWGLFGTAFNTEVAEIAEDAEKRWVVSWWVCAGWGDAQN